MRSGDQQNIGKAEPRVSGNLVLVGVRGSGKTTVGRALAARLGVEFIDLDQRVEKLAGRDINTLLTSEGEEAFRNLESQTLALLDPPSPAVIATGGGAILAAENRRRLKRLGRVVWLRVGAEEAARRLAASYARPPLTSLDPVEEARLLDARRRSLYESVSDLVVDTDGRTLNELCDELELFWRHISGDDVR